MAYVTNIPAEVVINGATIPAKQVTVQDNKVMVQLYVQLTDGKGVAVGDPQAIYAQADTGEPDIRANVKLQLIQQMKQLVEKAAIQDKFAQLLDGIESEIGG